ncbi:hypothetical protein [Vibrio anguillarum]|uniref:hypothetical protein n=2 Tax=Vibrio anguillarum TaxID=55601 RepID=UPI001163ACC2|nr:hypothetical protein [Vibrio anguillarum]MBT2928984.1 hypothetical protein [Vibrio anguillarum]QCW19901.1 hypothetical protein [Vibrio phage Va_PF430-3_p42]
MRLRDYMPSTLALSTLVIVAAGDAPGIIVWGVFFVALFVMPITGKLINKARVSSGLQSKSGSFYLAIGMGFYALLMVMYSFSGVDYDQYKNSTIAEIKQKPMTLRHDLVDAYMSGNGINQEAKDDFYSCFSHKTNTKSNKLEIDKVLGWCKDEYANKSDRFGTYINFDDFEKNLSMWDGSYRPLEVKIKSDMHNKSTYEHVSTRYRYILDGEPRAFVRSEFTGQNAYGAIVKQTATALISLPSGLIIEDSINYSGI